MRCRITQCRYGKVSASDVLFQTEKARRNPRLFSCYTAMITVRVHTPEWARHAAMYEINVRQYTEEGSIAAVMPHLPRIKALGADILWLMPVFPIGQAGRKGLLGSPYAISDHTSVNPELGTLEDLKALVRAAHALDMYVLLDWVADHTALDHPWVQAHPEWYMRDESGQMSAPHGTDWHDCYQLDFGQAALWPAMLEAMCHWVKEADIDGYRCDAANYVPLDFWVEARRQLERIKPVFMLAEAEGRELYADAFDAGYAWRYYGEWWHIANRKRNAHALRGMVTGDLNSFPQAGIPLYFTDNHDENARKTMREQFGPALEALMVLSCTLPGMPLIYGGQEAGLDKRLQYFERDPIEWRTSSIGTLIAQLLSLKKQNPALWNGRWGGRTRLLYTDRDDQVFGFARIGEPYRLVVLVNLSPRPVRCCLKDTWILGTYTDFFAQKEQTFSLQTVIRLPAWGYALYQQDHLHT